MAPLSQDNKNEVNLEIRKYFDEFIANQLPKIIEAHVNSCSHGRRITKWRWLAIGVGIGISFQLSAIGTEKLLSMLGG